MLPNFLLLPLLLLSLSLLLVTSAPAPLPAPGPAPAISPCDSATDFIRARCRRTRYPDLCFASLSAYAAAVDRNPAHLARAAANVTLARLRAIRAHVSALRRAYAAVAPGRAAAALRDCASQLGDAAYQVSRTAAELRGLESLVGMQEVAWRVSNAQTWMSAALTNEDSCTDGFHDVASAGGSVDLETDVCRRVRKVKQYTSNALALVNGLLERRR